MITDLTNLSDRELLLWGIIYVNARWENTTNEYCVNGFRHGCCGWDGDGFPKMNPSLKSDILEAAKKQELI